MTLDRLSELVQTQALEVFGLCHTIPDDQLGEGTLALLGPHEPGFWQNVQTAPEFGDGAPDPLDRWSARVITALAHDMGGVPVFPFGAPARPFISWAVRSGRAWSSPVGLLVHDRAGLMVSYRGAVLLPEKLPVSAPSDSPCLSCVGQPCLSACPVGALDAAGYDIPACKAFLDQPDGQSCLSEGCQVRRACPVSQRYPREPAQSAFHMAAFHKPS